MPDQACDDDCMSTLITVIVYANSAAEHQLLATPRHRLISKRSQP
jgi:hypothetical protein